MYRSREWILDRIRGDHRRSPHTPLQVLASRHRVSQRMVAEALALDLPYRARRPRHGLLAPVRPAIDRMLTEDLHRPPRERHTVRRILERLAAEHDFTAASYSTVRDYVRLRRAELTGTPEDAAFPVPGPGPASAAGP
ncbi:hypothetical protein [Streptomyces zhihengii]|uniref:Transposase n=1 Tax=Streptomyces zhihengii TaxID=1818004 RepID=A0ABS2UJ67_9ACTN|nr:hypothetical protein [Streptomyces zhihengii]MBM9617604.1 hypothetical protein [Streptomyces zhihengii]